MKIWIILTILMAPLNCMAEDVYVKGHYKKDGEYVLPYHRSTPDNSSYNNYSTQGNINPYTGEAGTEALPAMGNPPMMHDTKPKTNIQRY